MNMNYIYDGKLSLTRHARESVEYTVFHLIYKRFDNVCVDERSG